MSRELTDFTPFGYLRNPSHWARSWGETYGGSLRTATEYLGVEWAYPVGRDATSRAGLGVETTVQGRTCRTRADFEAIGAACSHHSCDLVGYEWQTSGVHVEAQFFLAQDDALCARAVATNTASEPRSIDISITRHQQGELPQCHTLDGQTSLAGELGPAESRSLVAVLTRHDAQRALATAEETYRRRLEDDATFLASCPTLEGDWPEHWREGLHHDFQTTRLLVQPPGGIFTDVWPAWMASWPRLVLAEGTLDMLRLAYADPPLAQRAILTLLRDAPEPNVPCVFRNGEYNMVAADGSRCGTSPAWCLPFLNLHMLYLRTLDRDWLAEVYPRAGAYLEWWLRHRTDADGWIVYKCTWESGEDGNPRLDPTGSGDADISGRVRPVELQATVAHAAGVLAFFARELGLDDARWRELAEGYRERTRALYEPAEGRYRDWLIAEQRFQSACPERRYWDVDPCRYSAQSLTPLLLGLPLEHDEVRRHLRPPWTLWPSWTWSVVESAAAAGLYAEVGNLAYQTIDRVYRVTTRRDSSTLGRPMPGCSPEFWPEDWRTYGGSDAYGWGATTANLLIRHLLGIKESKETQGWVLELTPSFPADMLADGASYAVHNVSYRGRRFDLRYRVDGGHLRAMLGMQGARHELELGNAEPFTFRLNSTSV